MPAPTNANGLSLGRPVIDPSTDDVQTLKQLLAQHYVGAGFPCGAQQGDAVYMAVYAQPDGLGAHILYGGNPTDPLNPHVLTVSAAGSATVIWQDEGSTVATYGTVSFEGAGVTVTDGGTKAIVTIPGGGGGGSTNAFGTIQVAGQSDVVADAAPDIVEFIAGTGMAITTSAGSDTVTFAINTSAVAQNSFTTIAVSGQSNVVADSPADTLTLVAGSNVTITTNAGSDSVTFAASGADGVGYDEIQEEGTPLTKRAKLNFIGASVTAADDAGNGRTNITISAATGSGTHVAMIVGNVPGTLDDDMDGVALTADVGFSSNGDEAVIMRLDGAFPPHWEEDTDYEPMYAMNNTETDFGASSGNPVLVRGVIHELTDNEDNTVYCFEIVGPFDHRSLTGYDIDESQIPYNIGGEHNFRLGGEACL